MAPNAPTTVSSPRAFWQSSIGKKAVMAVSGLILVLFLVAHMLGNLKIFFGAAEFDGYAGWLRTIGEPVLHHSWFLWIQRFVLLGALIAHITAATQLSLRDSRARPVRYQHHQRARATYATRTMRWGGVIVGLYIVWHVLDLTAGVVHPGFVPGAAYQNVVVDFSVWWRNLIYIVANVLVGLHINHGFHSAARTLGVSSPARDRAIRLTGNVVSIGLTAGFLSVPLAVMTGLVG